MSVNLKTLKIIPDDIYTAGICGKGARPFFLRHGLDWSDFVTNGISAQVLWDTGDGYARRVVTKKLETLTDG